MNNLKLCFVRDHYAWFTDCPLSLVEGENWIRPVASGACGDPVVPPTYTLYKVAWEGFLWLTNPSTSAMAHLASSFSILSTSAYAPPDTPTVLIHTGDTLSDFIQKVEEVGGTVYLPFGKEMTSKVARDSLNAAFEYMRKDILLEKAKGIPVGWADPLTGVWYRGQEPLLTADDAYLGGTTLANAQIYTTPITPQSPPVALVAEDEDTQPLPTLPPVEEEKPPSMSDTLHSILYMRGTSPLRRKE
jgi:hypothetical protein